MKLRLLCVPLVTLLCCTYAHSEESLLKEQPLKVIYPKPEREHESDNWYPLVLLKFALEHSGRAHTLESSVKMVQSRSLKELEQGDLVNIAWSMTSIERERTFNPVRIPIYKGLYGLRLLLTTQDKLSKFQTIKDLQSLNKIDFIQGHDWPDTDIISDNNLTVSTSTTYDALFNMLIKGRGDAFPRSILEVDWELQQLGQQTNIQVVPNIALSYPAAVYYFVNSKRPDIHQAIQLGLEKMHENGEFDRLFTHYFSQAIANAKLHEKTIIHLKNNHMSKLTPLENKQLWFNPNE
ncbi:substrate-binding periplasmic protein [Pseudoalteromonas sp. ZZD1]|uniref:substrate-binding periplasmic protein n=1 Tax=Pseudoalteromonas sp. ZZD1 TaxID=3139395 RepID=UPI003BAAD88B